MGVVELIYCFRGTFTFPLLFVLLKQRSQGSAAEIVLAAAENKKNIRQLRQKKLEKEPEKPAWLVEPGKDKSVIKVHVSITPSVLLPR